MSDVIDLAAIDLTAMDTSPVDIEAMALNLPRLSGAIHEASHVVMAAALRLNVEKVSVSDGGAGEVWIYYAGLSRMDRAIVCLSSFAIRAENAWDHDVVDDYHTAKEILGSEEAVLDAVKRVADYLKQEESQRQALLLGVCIYSRGTIYRPDQWVTVPPFERWWEQALI